MRSVAWLSFCWRTSTVRLLRRSCRSEPASGATIEAFTPCTIPAIWSASRSTLGANRNTVRRRVRLVDDVDVDVLTESAVRRRSVSAPGVDNLWAIANWFSPRADSRRVRVDVHGDRVRLDGGAVGPVRPDERIPVGVPSGVEPPDATNFASPPSVRVYPATAGTGRWKRQSHRWDTRRSRDTPKGRRSQRQSSPKRFVILSGR